MSSVLLFLKDSFAGYIIDSLIESLVIFCCFVFFFFLAVWICHLCLLISMISEISCQFYWGYFYVMRYFSLAAFKNHHTWEDFGYFVLKYSFCPFLSDFLWHSHYTYLVFFIVSHRFLRLSPFFYLFFLSILQTGNLNWPNFKFTNSFFCLFKSTVSS